MASASATPAWLVVARREFLVRVRTGWFIGVTLLGPIGMLGVILLPAWLSAKAAERGVEIQMVDETADHIGERVIANLGPAGYLLKISPIPADTPPAELLRRIRTKEIDGYLVLRPDVLETGEIEYYGANAADLKLRYLLSDGLRRGIQYLRAERAGIGPEVIDQITASVEVKTQLESGTGTRASGEASFILGYAVMFVLYLGIVLYGVNVMRSVVEEKTSRVVEILVSTIKPRPLMLGKIAGVGGVGLLQLGVWVGMAALIFTYRGALLSLFGVDGAGGSVGLPPLGLGAVAVILGYFVLGYFFYASLYAAIGAMVNSEQEAQQVQTPVIMLLIIPVACMQLVANDPRGAAAEWLTVIPFSSPVLMPMRYLLGGATTGEVALSVALLAASLVGAVWLAARIYRVGILMYGKRPSLRELAHWLRHG